MFRSRSEAFPLWVFAGGFALYLLFKNIFEGLFYSWAIKQLEVYLGIMEAQVTAKFAEVGISLVGVVAIVWLLFRYIGSNLRREFLTERQVLLDEIALLRGRLVSLRIELVQDAQGQKSAADWEKEFGSLQQEIEHKIEALAGKAEAHIYSRRGNVMRNLASKHPNQRLIDIAVHDLDHLKDFIAAYSRKGTAS
jgi:hypothetical protein